MRLLSGRVGAIVGEEDEASISIEGDGPFRAAEIEAPAALEPLIVRSSYVRRPYRDRTRQLATVASSSSMVPAANANSWLFTFF